MQRRGFVETMIGIAVAVGLWPRSVSRETPPIDVVWEWGIDQSMRPSFGAIRVDGPLFPGDVIRFERLKYTNGEAVWDYARGVEPWEIVMEYTIQKKTESMSFPVLDTWGHLRVSVRDPVLHMKGTAHADAKLVAASGTLPMRFT